MSKVFIRIQGWGCSSVVECLSNVHKVLNSIPSTVRTNKRRTQLYLCVCLVNGCFSPAMAENSHCNTDLWPTESKVFTIWPFTAPAKMACFACHLHPFLNAPIGSTLSGITKVSLGIWESKRVGWGGQSMRVPSKDKGPGLCLSGSK
jgi:hypothetical protein